MNRNSFRVYGLTCVFLMGAMAASATTIVLPTDEQLIAKTPVIIDGTVVSTNAVDQDGTIFTETVVSVARTLKGSAAGTLTVREIGGETADRITKIFGTPEFTAGERVLLFLEQSPSGGYRTVDLFVGKFSGGKTLDGRRMWLRDDASADAVLLNENLQPLDAGTAQRDAAGFENFVTDRVAGRPGAKSYGVENPVLAKDAAEGGGFKVQSDFTVISEPKIYRWRSFDSGQSAQWYSSGSQPGYPGGGVTELQNGMTSWTGYASAKIFYKYAGSRSGSMGGLGSANGVNEVLFNDPLGEISGTWNRSTGGVVGTGGFNGVSGSASWTAPFTADTTHTAGTKTAWTITEGNLVIQDGVSAAAGISSTTLAEIIAHEFGHTLGFGHSPDSTALMYYSVSGRGPSLRADDQTAARWLYPNGSAAPPAATIPAAPTALAAAVSGSNINLTWKDNAGNETGYRVYVNGGNQATLAANATGTTLSGLAAGTYSIYVAAYNSAGASQSNTVSSTIAGAVPVTPVVVAAFDFSPSVPAAGANVTFADRSSGSPTSWTWSFGDGATAAGANPVHAYAGPGTYTVTLTARNATSSATSSRQLTVSTTAAYRTLVSVAAQTSGIGGTSWRTELNVFNAGTQGASISLVFLPNAGGSVVTRGLFLAPKQSTTYANALLDLFGIGSGSGALAIEATSAGATADLRVTSRTFTTGSTGTYGQAVPEVQPGDLEKTLYITGIASNAAYRTNIGLVNRGGSTVTAALALYDATGAAIATKSVSLGGNSFQQAPLSAYFPAIDGTSREVLTMRLVAASQDAVSAYASVIDNLTQDPIYIQAVPAATGGVVTLPVVGRSPGVNGTFWRSDVTMYNPSTASSTLTLIYAGATRTHTLGGGDTLVLHDVLSEFGQASGTGTLRVSWSSETGPVVTSRTYTSVVTGGTFGQSIDPVAAFDTRMFVPGLRNDGSYRSNVGFVNGGPETEVFNVVLLSQSGNELGRKLLSINPNSQVQYSVSSLFPNLALGGGFTLQVQGDSNSRLFAYGSMVDNASGDPVFFAGR